MKIKPLFLLIVLFTCPLRNFSQNITQKLEKAYSGFERDKQLQYGLSSLTVLNAETGEIIFSRNSNVGLAPASTLKTITSATAFHLLGANFTWQTLLGYSGTVSVEGVLKGDIIIKGYGDPTLGSWRFSQAKSEVILQRWVNAIKQAGIKQIEGSIIGDDSVLGTQTIPGGWTWQDIGNYYGAGSSALTWGENQFDLFFQPGVKVSDPVVLLRTAPEIKYLKIVNEVTTGAAGSGDNVFAFSAPFSDIIYLRGTYGIDLKKTIAASIPDPAFEASIRLNESLRLAGVKVLKPITTARKLNLDHLKLPTNSKLLDIYTSPSLPEVINWFNKKSINLYGESILKTIALKSKNGVGTPEGVEIVKDFWCKKLGIDENSMNIMDGSGLSPENRITTLSMAKILLSAQKEPWFNSFYESLPVYNDMKMKSGTLRDVLAYTGYHTNSSGNKIVFSFIINNYNGSSSEIRQKMYQVLNELK